MSEQTPTFNEARVLTELKGYNWKLSMMFKLSSVPMEQIERNLQMMAKVVDSIPPEHPFTEKWTAKLERLFEKLVLNGKNGFPSGFVSPIDNKPTEEYQAASPVKSPSSPSNHQLSIIPNCRSESPVMNLTIDFLFTFNYQHAKPLTGKEAATGEMTFRLSFIGQDMGRIMAPPRRSSSTEAIRQIVQDANTEVNDDTVYSKICEAFDKVNPIDENEKQNEGIRDLVVLLVKCRIILRAFKPKNKYLEKAIFNWAYFKLSSGLAKEFKQQRLRMTYSSLISFLARLLTKMTYPTKKYPLAMVCFYCKHPGHLVRDCEKLLLITCFNCFEKGHTRHLCLNKKVDPKHLLDNL